MTSDLLFRVYLLHFIYAITWLGHGSDGYMQVRDSTGLPRARAPVPLVAGAAEILSGHALMMMPQHEGREADIKAETDLHARNDLEDMPDLAASSVSVTNDGPVILGSKATFVARVEGLPSEYLTRHNQLGKFFYVWSGPKAVDYLPQVMWDGPECQIWIPFQSQAGYMNITVEVRLKNYLGELVGTSSSPISVTETINGEIMTSASTYPGCNVTDPACSIPSRTNLTLTAAVHDPGDYFEGARFIYRWDLGNNDSRETYSSPDLIYSYPTRGEYEIKLNITAIGEEGSKRGYWIRPIKVLDAITNLTITSSSSSVQVGNREIVNVTCSGSPPVEVCLTIQEPFAHPINNTNTSTSCETVHECHTTMIYHFQTSGAYTFHAAASNNVSFADSVSTIHAHTPALPPQSIMAITVTIVAGLCLTSIGVAVFVQHVRKNRKQHVEVANFDFQASDSSVRMRASIFSWKQKAEKKPLLNNTSSPLYSL